MSAVTCKAAQHAAVANIDRGIARLLTDLQDDYGYTQADLAERAGLKAHSSISRHQSLASTMNASNLILLSRNLPHTAARERVARFMVESREHAVIPLARIPVKPDPMSEALDVGKCLYEVQALTHDALKDGRVDDNEHRLLSEAWQRFGSEWREYEVAAMAKRA